jgi:hypothetical protein
MLLVVGTKKSFRDEIQGLTILRVSSAAAASVPVCRQTKHNEAVGVYIRRK